MMKKIVSVGGVRLGGENAVAIQTMTNTKTSNVEETAAQIAECVALGADLVRVAVQSHEDAAALKLIKMRSSVPLIADIQFDYKAAIAAMENGADKIRINPGNLHQKHLKEIVGVAKERGVAIRVGVNSGSLDKDIREQYGHTANALAESCLRYAGLLEDLGFFDIVLAVKSSDVRRTVEAYRLLSQKSEYPLHIGVTEAGTYNMGIAKSYAGLGSLLLDGIGDTIRISLTDTPMQEVVAAKRLLRAVGLDKKFVEVISCPTCSRCNVNIAGIAAEVERRTAKISVPVRVAVMGCAVNGPGEARDADVGIAGGDGKVVVFKNGVVFKSVDESEAIEVLMGEIEDLVRERT